ncbi:hypothetical protein [Actinomadura mexicana]|uniref:Uncharacterized protein n=1 Tax=Actinomadura mexicana TaxID=134959 RepID=A0A238ZDE6_9ACTN|nr:hypothetical protein [Actinomadura mexicana]SNR81357.1 hypothetical protein SAMN06265355_107154 [Actinomadura mexicana]
MYRTHELRRVRTGETGLEEWACPTCGRRLLLQWPPRYHKTIVEPGDERACHIGRSDDITDYVTDTAPDTAGAGALGAAETPETDLQPNQRRWLRETGIETWNTPGRNRLNPSEPV